MVRDTPARGPARGQGHSSAAGGHAGTLALLLGITLLLGACHGNGSATLTQAVDSDTTSTPSTPAPSTPDAPTPGQAQAHWTTLGTRNTTSVPDPGITGNADASWQDYDPPALYAGTATLPMQYITLPDGTQLAAYVTLPADAGGNAAPGTFPTVLIQTAYNAGSSGLTNSLGVALIAGADPYLVEHGYAIVQVDVRGTGQSQGSWHAFDATEQNDYGRVVDWVTQQPWSDGRIGLYGASYMGITAAITAAQRHPAVKALFPVVFLGDGYRDIVFTGGQASSLFLPLWLTEVTALGVTNTTAVTDPTTGLPVLLNHLASALTGFQVPLLLNGLTGDADTAYDGPFWATRSPLETDARINVPTFVVGGLHDIFQRSEPMSYEQIKHHTTAKLLIGPWTHLTQGNGLPADGVPPLNHIQLQWFDQYVKGMDVGADKLPNVTQYVTGYGHYVTATDWPHPQARAQRLYLRGDKSLTTAAPADGEAANMVVALPVGGACSVSASQWTAGILGASGVPCFTGDDTLNSAVNTNYDSAAMPADYYLNGPIQADLWISSTASDAELAVWVDDVAPNGQVTALTNGIQSASLRAVDPGRSRYLDGSMIQPWHPYTQASVQPLQAGKPALVSVEIFATSALIKKGHHLRISVGASDLPQGVPPLPTLLNMTGSAVTTLYSDAAHPSSVVLPVVPATALSQ